MKLIAMFLILSSGLFAGQNSSPELLTLKLSPVDCPGAEEIVEQLPVEGAQGSLVDEPLVQAQLAALEDGEYEIVLTKPGFAYVGTCLVMAAQAGSGQAKRVQQTSGMEISQADYDQAVSDQASISSDGTKRL